MYQQKAVTLFQVILIAERGEAELGFAAIDSLTFKDLSEDPCETFPPQVTNHQQQNKQQNKQNKQNKQTNKTSTVSLLKT